MWKREKRVPYIRTAVVNRRLDLIVGEGSSAARSNDAFAAAGDEVCIADFSELISVVDVNGGLSRSDGQYYQSENDAAGHGTHNRGNRNL